MEILEGTYEETRIQMMWRITAVQQNAWDKKDIATYVTIQQGT